MIFLLLHAIACNNTSTTPVNWADRLAYLSIANLIHVDTISERAVESLSSRYSAHASAFVFQYSF